MSPFSCAPLCGTLQKSPTNQPSNRPAPIPPRCMSIHGTNDVLVSGNVGFNIPGHCYYLEDGEARSTVPSFLVCIRSSSAVCHQLRWQRRHPSTHLHSTWIDYSRPHPPTPSTTPKGVEERNVFLRNLAAYVHPIQAAGSPGGQQGTDRWAGPDLFDPSDSGGWPAGRTLCCMGDRSPLPPNAHRSQPPQPAAPNRPAKLDRQAPPASTPSTPTTRGSTTRPPAASPASPSPTRRAPSRTLWARRTRRGTLLNRAAARSSRFAATRRTAAVRRRVFGLAGLSIKW